MATNLVRSGQKWISLSEGFDGDIVQLADQIRRHPEMVRQIGVYDLVVTMASHWRIAEDVLDVTDQVPLTAWIVKRKAQGVLVEPDDDGDVDSEDDKDVAPWLMDAVNYLTRLASDRLPRFGRMVGWLGPVRVPIKDPNVWKLSWSWPQLRVRVTPTPRIISAKVDPLDDQIVQLQRRLGECDGPWKLSEWKDTGSPVSRFLAVVHLWHRGAAEAQQADSYAEIWVSRGSAFNG